METDIYMLTSRERLDRCFKQKEIDRPGLFIRGVGIDSPSHESYRSLRELVMANCDLKSIYNLSEYKELQFKLKKESTSEDYDKFTEIISTPKGDLFRTQFYGVHGNPGYTGKHFIETLDDAEKYLSMEWNEIDFDVEKISEMDREIGDRGIVAIELGLNPAGTVAELLGSETFALWSIENRDILYQLMEKEKLLIIKNIKSLLNKKAGLYYQILGEEYITQPLHGPKDFYDFNVTYDKQIIDIIHNAGCFVHVHCHGSIKNVLHHFIEIGADVLHPIEAPPMGDTPIKFAKEILRDKVCIEGNVQIGDMYEKDEQEIIAMTKSVIADAFDDSKGLILCPTASPYVPIMSERAFKNYSALISTVLDYK